MRYVEGVAGTRQTVDPTLPQDALEAVRTGSDLRDVARRYGEPIAALQDEDWRPPEPILFAYYSIYNLFEKYDQARDIDDWLIPNQALASLPADTIGSVVIVPHCLRIRTVQRRLSASQPPRLHLQVGTTWNSKLCELDALR
jgi:hypothetical protein